MNLGKWVDLVSDQALPLLRRRAMTAAQFLDIVCNNRRRAQTDALPWQLFVRLEASGRVDTVDTIAFERNVQGLAN